MEKANVDEALIKEVSAGIALYLFLDDGRSLVDERATIYEALKNLDDYFGAKMTLKKVPKSRALNSSEFGTVIEWLRNLGLNCRVSYWRGELPVIIASTEICDKPNFCGSSKGVFAFQEFPDEGSLKDPAPPEDITLAVMTDGIYALSVGKSTYYGTNVEECLFIFDSNLQGKLADLEAFEKAYSGPSISDPGLQSKITKYFTKHSFDCPLVFYDIDKTYYHEGHTGGL